MSVLSEVINLANSQHGVIARFQYRQLFISQSAMDKTLGNHVFERCAYGTHQIIGCAQTWHNKASKAVLSCGANALLSSISALINYGLLPTDHQKNFGKTYPFQNDPTKIHILCDRDKRHNRNINYHRTTRPEIENEKILISNILSVSPERAIVESAQSLGESNASRIIHLALTRNLTNATKIQKKISELKTAPGRGIKTICDVLQPYLLTNLDVRKLESVLEKRVYDILVKNINTTAELQYKIRCGSKVYRIDIAIPSQEIAIEIDGFAYHSSIEELSSDQARQNDLVNLGWRVIRINAKMTNEQILDTILGTFRR